MRIFWDLLLNALLGDAAGPVERVLMVGIAAALLLVAVAVVRAPGTATPRRSAIEVEAIMTVLINGIHLTATASVQARPGLTHRVLRSRLRAELGGPWNDDDARLLYWAVYPTMIHPGRARFSNRDRPSPITILSCTSTDPYPARTSW